MTPLISITVLYLCALVTIGLLLLWLGFLHWAVAVCGVWCVVSYGCACLEQWGRAAASSPAACGAAAACAVPCAPRTAHRMPYVSRWEFWRCIGIGIVHVVCGCMCACVCMRMCVKVTKKPQAHARSS